MNIIFTLCPDISNSLMKNTSRDKGKLAPLSAQSNSKHKFKICLFERKIRWKAPYICYSELYSIKVTQVI